jgi:hypothetical protein
MQLSLLAIDYDTDENSVLWHFVPIMLLTRRSTTPRLVTQISSPRFYIAMKGLMDVYGAPLSLGRCVYSWSSRRLVQMPVVVMVTMGHHCCHCRRCCMCLRNGSDNCGRGRQGCSFLGPKSGGVLQCSQLASGRGFRIRIQACKESSLELQLGSRSQGTAENQLDDKGQSEWVGHRFRHVGR